MLKTGLGDSESLRHSKFTTHSKFTIRSVFSMFGSFGLAERSHGKLRARTLGTCNEHSDTRTWVVTTGSFKTNVAPDPSFRVLGTLAKPVVCNRILISDSAREVWPVLLSEVLKGSERA